MNEDTRILLVEDDPDSAQLLKALLAEAGCGLVETAASAALARARLGLAGVPAGAPSAVLLDVGLPDGDGIDLCREIRAFEPLRHLPVLMVTARHDEDALEAAFAAGATDYVCKPVRGRELLARVRAAMARERELAEHRARETSLFGLARRLTRNNKDLKKLSTVDPLTGIANRRHFNAAFRLEWRRAARNRRPIAIAIADVDWFHDFNERHGHLDGDECLRRVVGALQDVGRRPPDLLARYGGEEFVYILADTDLAGARVVAERMRIAVTALDIPHEGSLHGRVTVSVGFASMSPRPDLSPEVLLGAADDALLEAKRMGRNRIEETDIPAAPSVVEVDPIVLRRVPTFLANRRADVVTLKELARSGQFEAAAHLGHRLKGTGPSFGFQALGHLGERVEQAARDGDNDGLVRCAAELSAYLDAVQVVPRGPTPQGVPTLAGAGGSRGNRGR